MKNYTAIIALALALPAGFANAQQPQDRPPGPPPGESRPHGDRPQGRTERGEKPHLPPVITALDKNGDGVISEDEIAGAAESLRKLAGEHGGKLTIEDLLGPPPREMRGNGGRPPGATREGQPRDNAGQRRGGPPDGQPRDNLSPRDSQPRLDAPREGAAYQQPAARRDGRFASRRDEAMRAPFPPPPPRDGRFAAHRDGFIPLPVPPRDGFNPDRFSPRDGEIRARSFAPRNDEGRRELDRPSREHSEPRPEQRRDAFVPPQSPRGGPGADRGLRPDGPREQVRGSHENAGRPRDGVRADEPREGGPRRERADRPRNDARPEPGPREGGRRIEGGEAPRGERPTAPAPRPDGESPRPNPEG